MFNMFRQPYLNEDDGIDLGGGDGFESEAIIPDETETPIEEPATETTPKEEVKQEVPKVKLKYNHEEKEYSLDEVVPLAQKGMNYDRLQEKLNALQSDPRLTFVESQAKRYNMTVDQYLEAVKQQEEQERLNELVQKNIPEDIAKEILESRQFREQQKAKEQEAAQKQRQQAEYQEFLEMYPNTKPEDIKPETWEKVGKGVPLKYAYMEQRMGDMQNEITVLKTNKQNEKKAPINGAASHGSAEVASQDAFLAGFDSI